MPFPNSKYCHVQNEGSSLNELYLKRRVKIFWHEMLCTYLSLFKANNHDVNPTQISSLFNLLHHWERAVRTPEEALHDEYGPLKKREELTFAPQKSSCNHNFLFDLNFICCYWNVTNGWLCSMFSPSWQIRRQRSGLQCKEGSSQHGSWYLAEACTNGCKWIIIF